MLEDDQDINFVYKFYSWCIIDLIGTSGLGSKCKVAYFQTADRCFRVQAYTSTLHLSHWIHNSQGYLNTWTMNWSQGEVHLWTRFFVPPQSWLESTKSPTCLRSLSSCGADQLLEAFCAHGLGSLDGEAKSPVPHQWRKDSQGTGYTEEHRVEVHLSHAIVLEEDAWVCINIGPGVLHLTKLSQDWGNDVVQLCNQL